VKAQGVKPPWAKAVTGHRTAKVDSSDITVRLL